MRDVTIVGAGPVGMLLAGDLVRQGLDVALLERRTVAGEGTRAIGIHSPVLAALEPSGVTDQLLSHALRVRRGEARRRGRLLGTVRFDALTTRFPFVATLPQSRTEEVLGARAPEPLRGARALAVIPRGDAVVVRAALQGRIIEMESRLVVVPAGAGGRELVFRPGAVPAREYRDRYLMTDAAAPGGADAEVAVVHLDPDGVLESFPLPGGRRRYVAWDAPDGDDGPDARRERLRAALVRRGEPEAAAAVSGATSFGVRRVVAPRLRRGRIFAIGDTAHEVSPIGGQGMNLGLLDAATLAPLLVEWVREGGAPPAGLERWEARRVVSARRAAALAFANTALGRPLGTADGPRRGVVRAMLAPPTAQLFARAYAMGFDLDA
ncbi:FAD-dependent monooxygenase [Microbacterium jejuense]|uniref:FAD-dependent monooxygenase n=1 Tax=Microbacterium jejuense TaxID=1263637 RepID=A0ABS7HV04_9MICO|nr:FAD-dependent monooxygenase [Microbacterium jejuense]